LPTLSSLEKPEICKKQRRPAVTALRSATSHVLDRARQLDCALVVALNAKSLMLTPEDDVQESISHASNPHLMGVIIRIYTRMKDA